MQNRSDNKVAERFVKRERARADGKLVLIVDDEHSICWAMERALVADGYRVEIASSAETGLETARLKCPAIVFLDVRLPGADGLQMLPKFIEQCEGVPVVIMTAFGDLQTAVQAVENGAADYMTKPFALSDVLRICEIHLASASSPVRFENDSSSNDVRQTLVGSSAAMQTVFRQIAFFAPSDLSVLITGETGTGKELVAAAIHQHSARKERPFLAVAPVAMNPELIESELFGHVRGAFTGADADRIGLFESAAGGTLLLDEIGDLAAHLQAKLLRVLEQGEFCRVGEAIPRRCDVRILAATNCDLQAAVADGSFREDLYYRLNGMHIQLPPLRRRTEDILPLCQHFLQSQRIDAAALMSEELLGQLADRPWHGNVRELKNAVCHAAVLARGRAMQLSDFPVPHPTEPSGDPLGQLVIDWAEKQIARGEPINGLHASLLSAVEPSLLAFALQKCDGNRAKAAELLGIHRGTLRERLKAHGIEPTT